MKWRRITNCCQFDLVGIPAAPRGVPQIEVTFDIDANGIVNVSAKDKATGKEQQIKIQASGGLSDEDIEKMVQDAEANAEEDKKRREKIEARNQAESLVHGAEKSLADLGDKADENLKADVEKAVADLKEALEDESNEDFGPQTEALSAALMKMGEAAYAASADDTDGEDANTDTASDDTVVDAEFEEVDADDDQKKASGS